MDIAILRALLKANKNQTKKILYHVFRSKFMTSFNQGRRAAFCLGASSCHLQSDNKMSPTNLKANFCTFLSILYKTAGKLVVFLRFFG